jgi:hypothetical protein
MRHSVPPAARPPQDEVKVAVYRDSLPAPESAESQLGERLIAAGLIGIGVIGLVANL